MAFPFLAKILSVLYGKRTIVVRIDQSQLLPFFSFVKKADEGFSHGFIMWMKIDGEVQCCAVTAEVPLSQHEGN